MTTGTNVTSIPIELYDLIASGIPFTDLQFTALLGGPEHGYIRVPIGSIQFEQILGVDLARPFVQPTDEQRAAAKARINAALETGDARLRGLIKVEWRKPG